MGGIWEAIWVHQNSQKSYPKKNRPAYGKLIIIKWIQNKARLSMTVCPVSSEAATIFFFRVTFGGHSDRLADAPPKLPHIWNLTPE